jgi:hypothetical protein
MVISRTNALAVKTHAVSPEFIFSTSFKNFSFGFPYRKDGAKPSDD